MIPVKHIDPEDLPLYAMQLLPPEEAAEITLHLQHSAEARKELASIQGDLALLAHTAEMHSPPALARQRLMKHVAREKKPVPIDAVPDGAYAPRESSLFAVADVDAHDAPAAGFRILPWIGWALAAGLCFSSFYLYDQSQRLRTDLAAQKNLVSRLSVESEMSKTIVATMQDPIATRVTLVQPDARPAPQGRATYDAEKGSLIFLASNLEPLRPYKTYELWLIPADGRDPIPAGTFKPDARGYASVVMPPLPKGIAAGAFGVTVEDDERPAQAPTMPIILKGQPS